MKAVKSEIEEPAIQPSQPPTDMPMKPINRFSGRFP